MSVLLPRVRSGGRGVGRQDGSHGKAIATEGTQPLATMSGGGAAGGSNSAAALQSTGLAAGKVE